MEKLIIRKKMPLRHMIETIILFSCWIIVILIASLLIVAGLGIYGDSIVSIYLLTGFPLDNIETIFYLFCCTASLLSWPIISVFEKSVVEGGGL